MNHTGVLSLGGALSYRNGAFPLPVNQRYASPQRYYQNTIKPQFVPHATPLDTVLAPPNYYDVSLSQTANHIRVNQLMQEMPPQEIVDCKPFKATQRHNFEQLNPVQRHSCDTSKPTHLEPVSATHGDTKSRVERRINELNSQLQSAPRDTGSPWWDELADNFFHNHSTILVLLPQGGRKDTKQSRFHLEKTPLAAMEFFKNLYEHQVSQVGISLNNNLIVTENQWTGEITSQAPNAVLFTQHHKPQSVKVTTEGSMSIIFTPQLKIQHLEFDIKSATEFVARKNFQNLNKSGIQEMRANSTCYGIHNETIEFLKMTRVLESMQTMMAQHKSRNSIPKEIETSGTQSTQEEDTPTPHSIPAKIPGSTQARNHGNYKNVKNARKNRKRKLNSEWNRNKRTKGEERFETVTEAEVEVIRHNPEVAGRVIYSMSKPHLSNSRGMYQNPAPTNQML